MISLTVIAHFYKGELLLPYWLLHHRNLFQHGIMIDYASTDRSVEIIRELVPTWEVRLSRSVIFASEEVDAKIRTIEEEVSGWKMVLNITGFIINDYDELARRWNHNAVKQP